MKFVLAVLLTLLPVTAHATGPRGPVGPQPQPPCVGVALTSGANIQGVVNANPAGTKFCLAAGTYARQYVQPKAGNTFEGVPGTILDGQNVATTQKAFFGGASNVTIKNLRVTNYKGSGANARQQAAIDAVGSTGWQLLNLEIDHNDGVGILLGYNILAQYNYIHHNYEMGFGSDGTWANPGVGINFQDNKVAFNNYTDKYDCDECGGAKLWASKGAYIGWNEFASNHGPGLWFDFNNINYKVEQNFIHDNFGPGIEIEISYDGEINNNAVWHNGNASWPKWNCSAFFCGQIMIAASGGVGAGIVNVRNNSIFTSAGYGDGIGLIQQDRTNHQDAPTPWLVRNVKVSSNGVNLCKGGGVGGFQDTGGPSLFAPSAGNVFSKNTYTYLNCNNNSPFQWPNAGDKVFWQSKGMDLTGTFK